jgi:hypothetical protein
MQGMDIKTYLQYMGGNIDDFKNTFIPQAENQVKIRLALEKIAVLEKLEPTAENIEAEFEKLAKEYGIEIDKVKASIPEKELVKDLAVSKAMELVKASAKVAEVDQKTENKPAAKKTTKKADTTEKKPAAKKTTTKKAEGEVAEKKPAAKKTTAKKAEGEATEKKPAAKKTTAKKADGEAVAKKPAAKKTSTAKKTASKDAE